mgnify:CR=1 FL=1
MPAVSQRGGGRRRTINEINMVPFIDVMLVLLIIFMVSAPLITTGVVDLPTVGKSKQRPEHVVELIVGRDERIRIRVDSKDEGQAVALDRIAARVLDLQAGDRLSITLTVPPGKGKLELTLEKPSGEVVTTGLTASATVGPKIAW